MRPIVLTEALLRRLPESILDAISQGVASLPAAEHAEFVRLNERRMDADQYQRLALRTEHTPLFIAIPEERRTGQTSISGTAAAHRLARLMHGAMGLCKESAEVMNVLYKHLMYGAPLDEAHLQEEIGDVFWFAGETLDALGKTISETMELNIRKLRVRYPDGFSADRALRRPAETTIAKSSCDGTCPVHGWDGDGGATGARCDAESSTVVATDGATTATVTACCIDPSACLSMSDLCMIKRYKTVLRNDVSRKVTRESVEEGIRQLEEFKKMDGRPFDRFDDASTDETTDGKK